MASIFITGSADGLGHLAAKALVKQGHQVVLHARNAERARQAWQAVPGAAQAIAGDLADLAAVKGVAAAANAWGRFDAVIHNAGVYQAPAPTIFQVNLIAPYVLTCLMQRPQRLIYLSSGLHLSGRANLAALREQPPRITYSDSKLYVVMLCLALARLWPGVYANAVDPGWVPTKMGGPGAPDDLQEGYATQVWLATSDDAKARVSGQYFFHRTVRPHNPQASNVALQARFLEACEAVTDVALPT